VRSISSLRSSGEFRQPAVIELKKIETNTLLGREAPPDFPQPRMLVLSVDERIAATASRNRRNTGRRISRPNKGHNKHFATDIPSPHGAQLP
jgi:hypothetical protein